MCSRQEIEEIIKYHLAQHEVKDIQRHVEFDDKLDKTLVAVRDSVPPSLSEVLKRLEDKVDRLNIKVDPFIDFLDASSLVGRWTRAVAQFMIYIGVIIGMIYGIKEWIKK